jgi:hypothetical protein
VKIFQIPLSLFRQYYLIYIVTRPQKSVHPYSRMQKEIPIEGGCAFCSTAALGLESGANVNVVRALEQAWEFRQSDSNIETGHM